MDISRIHDEVVEILGVHGEVCRSHGEGVDLCEAVDCFRYACGGVECSACIAVVQYSGMHVRLRICQVKRLLILCQVCMLLLHFPAASM